MRRSRLAAPSLAVALALIFAACSDGGSSADRDEGPAPGRFGEIRLDQGSIVATTGRFVVEVTTDPLHLEARLDGERLMAEAPDGGLYLVRDGQVVDAETASVRATDVDGLVFDVAFADGSRGQLEVNPVSEGTVQVLLRPEQRAGITHWGERLALQPDEQTYGITEAVATGVGQAGTLDLRGELVSVANDGIDLTSAPFHQSSQGYGLLVEGFEAATYDVGVTDPDVLDLRVAMPVDAVDALGYDLFVGPGYEQVLEEHLPNVSEMVLGTAVIGAPAPTTEEALRSELVATQRAAFLGTSFRGTQVPTAALAEDPEVAERASQLAAVAPVVGTPPAQMDDRTTALKELLRPYVEALLEEAHETGLTPVRPLVFRYPDQGAAADRWDEWLLGDDLLVAPVWEVGDRGRTVWFPPGRWVDFWDRDRVVEGPIQLEVDAPLDTLPLYVAEGSDLLDLDAPAGGAS